MKYSGENPCEVSPECYWDIETALECWFNSENNAYDVLKAVKQKKVFTSLYSKVNQQTFYFLDY